MRGYFLDTYAMHEILVGNATYQRFGERIGLATSKLNLMELYYTFLIRYGEKTAASAYAEFREYSLEFDDETIQEAMRFRAANRTKSLSYVDCLGYTMARGRNLLFVTGDKEFKDRDDVEFIP